jgi:hypothetical protein
VGVGNPAEETYCYPNVSFLRFLRPYVNKLSFTSKLSFLAYLGFTTPIFYHLQFAFALERRSATVAINFTAATKKCAITG